MSPASAPAAALVQQGLAAQQAGDTVRAEALYAQALALEPGQPDALQLQGLLARRRGDLVQAEALMRASLASREAQPHVWNNLGNVLLAAGRSAEAQACYARAVALAPAYADALYNLARLQYANGHAGGHAGGPANENGAAALLARAMATPAGASAAMLQLQAQMQADAGQTDPALATLERALALAPQRAALHHNRAVLLQRQQRPREALAAHERALALGADAPDAHYNHGNTLQSLGRHEEALQAYRHALARDGGHALALYDLARLRWRLGDADFDAELRAAQTQAGAAPALAGLHAHLLWRAERFADAAQAYRRALQGLPGAAAMHDGLARCLVRLGELPAGLAAHAQAVALAPADGELHAHHAASLLLAGRTEAALAAAEAACHHAPLHQQAQALRVLAWRLLGDARAAWADDPQRLVQAFDLEAPPGFANMADFNAALADELRRLHHDRHAPIDQTLRGGTQTVGNLFDQGHALVGALQARITEAVNRYIAALPADPGHPFLARRAAAAAGWRFTDSWSSRLQSWGFHSDHVHPHGWLSSAYYVAVPTVCADTTARQGWLRFGRPDLALPGLHLDSLVQREVQPQPGRLVLFPSMAWHGTRPFEAPAERLTVAFDVMPKPVMPK